MEDRDEETRIYIAKVIARELHKYYSLWGKPARSHKVFNKRARALTKIGMRMEEFIEWAEEHNYIIVVQSPEYKKYAFDKLTYDALDQDEIVDLLSRLD